MEPILHAANGLLLLSYAVRDILWLRLLTVAGLGLLLGHELDLDRTPSPGAAWTLGFVALNGVHALWLIWERRPVVLTDEERAVRYLVFEGLTDRQFANLLALGEWEELGRGSGLLAADQPVRVVRLICAGHAAVVRDGRTVQRLGPGAFVGEIGFLTGQTSSAAVVARDPLTCLAWPAAALRDAIEDDPHLRAVVQGSLGVDVALKLRAS